MINEQLSRYIVDQSGLPENYPTHAHDAYFWECLGRTVATFGFLEEVLTKAIFAFTATTNYSEEKIGEAYVQWLPKLERSLSDQLGGLIDTYDKAVRDNSEATIENLGDLLSDLREASKLRNVLCHGSWRTPDKNGASTPFFVNRQKERFETSIDISFLKQVQKHTTELICAVVNSVTHMGWQFPGSTGPGKVIWGNE
jgi:uncharacterized protein (DUF2132 family)